MDKNSIFFILIIIAFMLLGIKLYFTVAKVLFKQLRIQNVGVLEALFLSFVYSISYLWSRGIWAREDWEILELARKNLEISKERILKLAFNTFIMIFGVLVILLICIIYIRLHIL